MPKIVHAPILEQAGFVKGALESAFTPLDLFSNGEEGVWYDPSDLSTLFLDAAGTTPVTADGDPVGLMLDKSQRLELGPELVTNGTFDSDIDGWLNQATALPNEWDAGRIKVYHSSSPTGAWTTIVTEPGKVYKFVGKLVSSTSFSVTTCLRAGSGTQPDAGIADSQIISEPGTYSLIFTAQSTTSYVYLRNDSLAVTLWDNISVRELHGNHATQSVSTSRPTYRTDGTLHWLEFDGVDDYFEVKPFAVAMQQPYSFVAGVQRMAATGSASLVDCSVVATRFAIVDLNQSSYVSAGISVKDTLPSNTGDKHVLTVFASGIDSKMQSGKEAIVTADIGNNPINNILIATRDGSIGFSKNNLYGVLYVKGAIEDVGQIQDYLASKSGVTL